MLVSIDNTNEEPILKTLMISSFLFLLLLSSQLSNAHEKEDTRVNPSVKAYIIAPKNGDTVSTSFQVKFGLDGMIVSPAGIERPNSGHHHLLVDGQEMLDLTKHLGAEVLHFGKGQTETTLSLEPGEHTLQLILGDHMHIPHTPPVISSIITVLVK